MFIRRTQIQKRKAGGHYYTYRLVESLRTEKGVRQHTLLNPGTDFCLPKDQWPILAKRVHDILHNQQPLFELACDIKRLARNIAAKIIVRQQDNNDDSDIDYREVDIDSLEMSRQRSVGCEHVTLEALRSLGLDTKLQELGFTGPQAALAIGTIIGRACHPGMW